MFPKLLLRSASLCIALIVSFADAGCALELEPFRSGNMSPIARIFGIPLAGSARIVDPGTGEVEALLEVANNFTESSVADREIILDSEIWQVTLGVRHGISANTEASIQIPVLYQGGGVFDPFLEDWHSFFGLPQGGRDTAPRDRLLYRYREEGVNRVNLTNSDSGIGDLRLGCGYQLFKSPDRRKSSAAVRASLKLPTGSSSAIRGSGSTDLSLWIAADHSIEVSGGTVTGFVSAGGTAMTDGNILPDIQRNLVAFGSLGAGWAPWESVGLKLQVNGHSALYKSRLRELGQPAVQLLVGGTVAFSPAASLDIGVSEDIVTNSSADVAFHIGLVTRY